MKPCRFQLALSALAALTAFEARAEVEGSVAIVSDYLFRGVTQTDGEPAIQGGVQYGHPGGFYIGVWGSSISWLADADPEVSSQVELDGYLGFAGEFGASGIGYDVGAVRYAYPGSYPPGFEDPDTTELYAGLSWGAFGAKYSHAVTDLFGLPDSDGSGHLELTAAWEFAPAWTLDGAVGRQWVSGHSGADYTHWKVGVTRAFDNGFELAAAWIDTDLDGGDDAVVVSATKGF
ncbi:TorF family putative porin [Luteimonas sp. Y-2-2-4F]|nr:TorF family putative porin [Luteimonas sp. Y-2-2-4F]MCD9032619.1 TorF family putative porin [Luteimonas sp. Y-2-2-4F]